MAEPTSLLETVRQLIGDEPTRAEFADDPDAFLEARGLADWSAADLSTAFEHAADAVPPAAAAEIHEGLRADGAADPDAMFAQLTAIDPGALTPVEPADELQASPDPASPDPADSDPADSDPADADAADADAPGTDEAETGEATDFGSGAGAEGDTEGAVGDTVDGDLGGDDLGDDEFDHDLAESDADMSAETGEVVDPLDLLDDPAVDPDAGADDGFGTGEEAAGTADDPEGDDGVDGTFDLV